MDLTTDNLYIFITRRLKQSNKKSDLDPLSRSPSPKKNPSKSEIINYFQGLIINNSGVSNIIYNSIDPFINKCFENLQYLSMANNFIRNLNFLEKLPNLFYFDAYNNPIEELNSLNNRNIFGYMRLSLERFNEKKILNVVGLCCGIFDMDLNNKSILKSFKNNNPEICVFNSEVNYFIDKLKFDDKRKSPKKKLKKEKRGSEVSLISCYSNNTIENKIDEHSSSNKLLTINNLTSNKNVGFDELISEEPIVKIETTNQDLLKIKKYFDEYKKVIFRILNFNSEKDTNSDENNNNSPRLILKKNSLNFVNYNKFLEDKEYIEIEKKKLLLIFDIYKKISFYNNNKNNLKYYIGNINSINQNNNLDFILVKEIKDYLSNRHQCIRASLIILTTLFFYLMSTISSKMMLTIIKYVLTKYFKYEGKNINKNYDYSSMGNIHFLCFYYNALDYIENKFLNNKDSFNIDKYKEILNILKMDKIILKSNFLHKKFNDNLKNIKHPLYWKNKKENIINEIRCLNKDLNIRKEFLVLIAFLHDYIIFEKIEQLLIDNTSSDEYSYIIGLKESLEETELKRFNNEDSQSLSVVKFQKNQKERIFNKFYFKQDKIKSIKNRDFIIETDKINTFNNNINNSNKSLLYNQDNEYNKTDDLDDVDQFLVIDKLICNNNNNSNRFNNNIKKIEENDCFQGTYYNNNSRSSNFLLKLPNISQTKSYYGELEIFKKIIIDPEFLSQHARNVLKFEKTQKNLKKLRLIKRGTSIKKQKQKIMKIFNLKNNNENNVLENNNNISNNDYRLKTIKTKMPNNFREMINYDTTTSNMNIKSNMNRTKFISSLIETENAVPKNTFNKEEEKICYKLKNNFKSPFKEIPESFPGMTLLKFGLPKNKINLKMRNKSNLGRIFSNNIIKNENENITNKEQLKIKIRQLPTENVMRNARRTVYMSK